MAYTGYLVSVFMDANPYSPTYGQERTERELDTNECPVEQQPNYVHIYTYCEMSPNGAYTGNCVMVYEDVEPMSATYGQQREEVSTDGVLCPPDSADADWREIDSYCEQIAYQPSGKLGNSGFKITVYMDYGEYSPTYHQTREERTQDLVHCTLPSTEDVWIIISETCHLENGVQDGTKDVVRVNTNEYSPNYNDGATETINVEDLVMCPRDPSAPLWTEISYVCEQVDGYNTGFTVITEEDTNQNSSTFGQQRTRRVSDDTRCPVQTADTFTWRIINNRSASTDTISNITVSFNSGAFDIVAAGSLTPVGGQINGSSVMPNGLKSTGLVCDSITLSPNSSMPTLYQFSQNPNPYTWNTDYASTLIITLWDGDGTGPEWTEVSYSCETVDGYRTGASTVVEEDMNPQSATYGQQRTRTIENDPRCPAQTDAVWVETSWTCETVNGYNTGNRLSVQTDTNPNSSTYGSTRTRIIQDLENCPISTTAAWTEISYVCEQQDGFNTGNTIITEEDKNPGSATYGQTRTRTVSDDPRCLEDTEPNWVVESYVCETDDPTWTEVSRTCETDNYGENTGNALVTQEDTNPNSSTYGTTRTVTELDLTNCPTSAPGNYKLRYTTTNDDGIIVCNQDTTLSETETSSLRTTITSAKIGTCVETIGMRSFRDSDYLTSVIMANTVTSIGNLAFSDCASLTQITLPNGITSLGVGVFSNDYNLETANIPTSLTVIPSSLFAFCSSLDSITIPNNITSIGESSFDSCSSLTSVVIPSSVTTIGERAFVECTGLTSLNLSNGLTTINSEAFSYCTGLTSITLPSTITYIGYGAFSHCTGLTSITILATTPPQTYRQASDDAFADTNNCPIYVPAASLNDYMTSLYWYSYRSRLQAIP